MDLLLDYVVVDDSGLHLLAGHLLAQLVETGQLLGRDPDVLQVETLVKR